MTFRSLIIVNERSLVKMFLQDTDESGPASPKDRQCGHAITSIRFVTAAPGSCSVIECDSDIEKEALFRYNLFGCFEEDRPTNEKRPYS